MSDCPDPIATLFRTVPLFGQRYHSSPCRVGACQVRAQQAGCSGGESAGLGIRGLGTGH